MVTLLNILAIIKGMSFYKWYNLELVCNAHTIKFFILLKYFIAALGVNYINLVNKLNACMPLYWKGNLYNLKY